MRSEGANHWPFASVIRRRGVAVEDSGMFDRGLQSPRTGTVPFRAAGGRANHICLPPSGQNVFRVSAIL